MNDLGEYQFLDQRFEVLYEDNKGPRWTSVVEATDRKLIGTEYVERNWRHTVWVFECQAWIPPDSTAEARFKVLRDAYKDQIIGAWSNSLVTYEAMIVGFEMQAIKNGYDGFEGKVIFILPYGKPDET
jgi:hypothetical protein